MDPSSDSSRIAHFLDLLLSHVVGATSFAIEVLPGLCRKSDGLPGVATLVNERLEVIEACLLVARDSGGIRSAGVRTRGGGLKQREVVRVEREELADPGRSFESLAHIVRATCRICIRDETNLVLLRLTGELSVTDGLVAESLAYSMLLASAASADL